ncbi:MAG: nicotinate-nicotinamide nucleotide adenylyltransferase [Dehalococcoidia bacterium]
MSSAIAEAIEQLDQQTGPAARRFDHGPAFSGAAAVLPSAYNPPTLAHEHLLQRALDAYGLHHAVALLTTRNVDKGLHGASLADRIGMLLALSGSWPGLCVAASNQARIVDQANALNAAFPGVEFDFIVGFDTLERLFAPRYYTDMDAELAPFFARHRLLAANRGDVEAHHVEAWVAENAGTFAGRILLLEIDEFPASLSSTRVREAAAKGGDGLDLPPAVARYVTEHGLYR